MHKPMWISFNTACSDKSSTRLHVAVSVVPRALAVHRAGSVRVRPPETLTTNNLENVGSPEVPTVSVRRALMQEETPVVQLLSAQTSKCQLLDSSSRNRSPSTRVTLTQQDEPTINRGSSVLRRSSTFILSVRSWNRDQGECQAQLHVTGRSVVHVRRVVQDCRVSEMWVSFSQKTLSSVLSSSVCVVGNDQVFRSESAPTPQSASVPDAAKDVTLAADSTCAAPELREADSSLDAESHSKVYCDLALPFLQVASLVVHVPSRHQPSLLQCGFDRLWCEVSLLCSSAA